MAARRLGQYEVLEEVGHGGMAVVYRGVDPALGRTVAIKVLHPHLSREAESRQRFHREARAVAQLRHPNIIEIYAYSGLDSEDTYLVTEFIDGPDLKRFVREHPVRLPPVAALIALPIAAALTHAHGLGIVHRDIKPENIMIQRGGVPKLTDFGIAHLIDDQMTVTGAILGSPAYMSPEHVQGSAMDGRADVFSLGTLLYALAAGRLPFQAETPHALLRQVLDCNVPDPRRFNPLIDDDLHAIIRRAMQRKPEDRYPTIERMALDLRRYLEEEGFDEPDVALRAFLADPEGYQELLSRKLADRYLGQARAAADRGRLARALELYDRVLQLDESSEDVVQEVRRVTSRYRVRRTFRRAILLVSVAVALVLGGLAAANLLQRWRTPSPAPELPPRLAVTADDTGRADDIRAPADGEGEREPPARVVVRRPPGERRPAYDLSDMAPARPRLALETELTRPRPIARLHRPVTRRPEHPDASTRPDAEGGGPAVEPTLVPVVIKADPPAVQITVDGIHRGVGKTPRFFLLPGRHKVTLKHPACPHCLETETSFVLDAANPPEAALPFRIRYRPARLVVDAPVQARVYVDRRAAGRTAQAILVTMGEQAERQVDVTVRADGYLPWERRVTVGAGANVRLAADLRPKE